MVQHKKQNKNHTKSVKINDNVKIIYFLFRHHRSLVSYNFFNNCATNKLIKQINKCIKK